MQKNVLIVEAIQERVKLDKPTTFYDGKKRIFPTEIREILSKITDEELKKVGVNANTCQTRMGSFNFTY